MISAKQISDKWSTEHILKVRCRTMTHFPSTFKESFICEICMACYSSTYTSVFLDSILQEARHEDHVTGYHWRVPHFILSRPQFLLIILWQCELLRQARKGLALLGVGPRISVWWVTYFKRIHDEALLCSFMTTHYKNFQQQPERHTTSVLIPASLITRDTASAERSVPQLQTSRDAASSLHKPSHKNKSAK
jgi:hypothetical protein